MTFLSLGLLFAASCAAGIVNVLAGGGSFLTFPALLLTGLDPRAANITSTLALYPMQVTTGYAGRRLAGGTPQLTLRTLVIISFTGGVGGALLLLQTPPTFFARLAPWLILLATALFAYGSFFKKSSELAGPQTFGKVGSVVSQICISIYGGYFGGGIGFLMLAALTLAGMTMRKAAATKNILAAVMNSAAVVIFLFSNDIGWIQVGVGAAGSTLGGWFGLKLLHKVNEKPLRFSVVAIGLVLTIFMFMR